MSRIALEKIEGPFTPVALDDVATDTFTLLLDAQTGLARELFRAQQCEYSYDKYHPASREPWEQPALELVLIMLLPSTGSEHAGRFIDLRDAMVRAAKTAGFLIDYQVSTATLRRNTLLFKCTSLI